MNVKQGKPSDVDRLAFTSKSMEDASSQQRCIPHSSLAVASSLDSLLYTPPTSVSGIRSLPTASRLSHTSSSVSISPEVVDGVIDSVVSALLSDSPPYRPSNPPCNLTDHSLFLNDLEGLLSGSGFLVDAQTQEREKKNPVDEFLSECLLPPVMEGRRASDIFGCSLEWNPQEEIFGSYDEAVDDEDDIIEEEYLSRQLRRPAITYYKPRVDDELFVTQRISMKQPCRS